MKKEPLAHEELNYAIKNTLLKSGRGMVVIVKTTNDKPDMITGINIDELVYNFQSDKFGYIEKVTGIPKESILLPITNEVIDWYGRNYNTKSINRIEQEIYRRVLRDNN